MRYRSTNGLQTWCLHDVRASAVHFEKVEPVRLRLWYEITRCVILSPSPPPSSLAQVAMTDVPTLNTSLVMSTVVDM